MRIVFFGTPDFAVPSLRALIGEGFAPVAVVTQPDKPRGRSRSTLVPPPVKSVALEEGLEVFQPDRPRGLEFMERFRALEPDLGVVVAYGHILRPEVLAVPRRGMINVHASLLPRYRGAAPIQHALLDGVETTGVTIMQMDEGMDTGPIIRQVEDHVAPDETFGELQVRLAEIGAQVLIEALTMIELGRAEPEPQREDLATLAPKITRATARIDWSRPAVDIARQVRAFDPAPGAWTTLDGSEVKLFGPAPTRRSSDVPGKVTAGTVGLAVDTGTTALEFVDVKPAGRRRMPANDWLRGRALRPDATFD